MNDSFAAMTMTKQDVKTWSDLVAFAKERAVKSVKRNDPIAWAYWKDTEEWARLNTGIFEPDMWAHSAHWYVERAAYLKNTDPREAARNYSRAKWLRILSINSGKGNVKPLSLAWLKEDTVHVSQETHKAAQAQGVVPCS